jgi:hypothetical protein
MIEQAELFISRIPSDAVGFVFLEGAKPVQPDLEALGRYQRHAGAPGGVLAVLFGNIERHVGALQQKAERQRAEAVTCRNG